MEREKLQQFKTILLEERKKLERELKEIANKNPTVKGDFKARFPQYGDTNDENAQEVADFEKMKSLEYELETKLEKINKTLEKIEQGNFGICEICKKPIEELRLKAMPVVATCSVCVKKLNK